MNLKPLQDWIDKYKFTDEESFVLTPYQLTKEEGEHKDLDAQIFERLPLANITTDDYNIGFADCATDIINQILDNEKITAETLVIISSDEHENVVKATNKLPNLLVISQSSRIHKMDFSEIYQYVPDEKNVLVYIIGTQLSTGIITPNDWFIELRKILDSKKCKSTFVLDDVQGMFIVPRDYSIFDYIIGTCHSLTCFFNMGFIIQKNTAEVQYGKPWATDEKEYIKHLDVLLSKLDGLNQFTMVMRQVLAVEMSKEESKFFDKAANNIVSARFGDSAEGVVPFTQKEFNLFNKYFLHIENLQNEEQYVRFRAQEVLYDSDAVLRGLNLLEEYLQNYY